MPEFSSRELLKMEKETIGMYLSGHPCEEYTEKISKITNFTIGDVLSAVEKDEEGNFQIVNDKICDGMFIKLCGIISTRKNKITRNSSQMAFVTIEDVFGSIEVLVFPKILTKYSYLLEEERIVLIEGKLSLREDEEPKLLCEKVLGIEQIEDIPKTIFIKIPTKDKSAIEKLKNIAGSFSGKVSVCFYVEETKERFSVPDVLKLSGTGNCMKELKKCFGDDCVKGVF